MHSYLFQTDTQTKPRHQNYRSQLSSFQSHEREKFLFLKGQYRGKEWAGTIFVFSSSGFNFSLFKKMWYLTHHRHKTVTEAQDFRNCFHSL
jgi:hypothetical protein